MSNDQFDGRDGNGYQPKAKPAEGNGPDKLSVLKFDPSAMEQACAYMERNLEAMTRYQRAYARLQRERFVSLVAVGFTPDQALELICRTSMFGN